MQTFYFTFGQKYRFEPHPSGKEVHPDGYVAVVAEDEMVAREIMFRHYGMHWAFQYSKKPSKELFPIGILETLQ